MRIKSTLLATAAVAVAAAAAPASAQTIDTVYGNGASLPAPYFRLAADCYAENADLIFQGSPEATVQALPGFVYTGAVDAQDCGVDAQDKSQTQKLVYKSTGSGTGIAAFYSNSPAVAGDIDPTAGSQLFPAIHYALSETPLGSSDVTKYNTGGTVQGVTVVAKGVDPATTAAVDYANPQNTYGNMVQFPVLIAPVTIAFDPVYKKVRNADGSITEYKFNQKFARADGSGGLRLTQAAVCGIFNGTVVDWKDAAIVNQNGGSFQVKDALDPNGFSVPLQIVGRSDSSGTTSLWTRFIANACATFAGNQHADSTSRLPGVYKDNTGSTRTTATVTAGADLVGAVWDKASANSGAGAVYFFPADNGAETIGKYTVADGNDGVAKYIDFTAEPTMVAGNTIKQGRVGYLGPDYTLPAVLYTNANNYGLNTFDVANITGLFRAPNTTTANAAFGTVLPPQSTRTGAYDATKPGLRANPADWVQAASKTAALANPTHGNAYPIVGTSNMLAYTCYKTLAAVRTLRGFVNYYTQSNTVNDATLGLLASSGFAPMPASWRRAIAETFTNTLDPYGLKLTMSVRSSTSTQCPLSIPGA